MKNDKQISSDSIRDVVADEVGKDFDLVSGKTDSAEQVEKDSEGFFTRAFAKLMNEDDWTQEDENALEEFGGLLCYNPDEDDDLDGTFSEWTEWVVLSGEMEALAFTSSGHPIWGWMLDEETAEIPGYEYSYADRDDAKRIFDEIDPMGSWFGRRVAEAKRGETLNLERCFQVELVCQTIRRDANGTESVRDDSVRLVKCFHIYDDVPAQVLVKSLVEHF